MKERVFYIINLDKQRIGVLSLFLFALFFSFFFLGVSVGKGRTEVINQTQSVTKQEEVITNSQISLAQANPSLTNADETIPLPKSNGMEIPMADLQPGNTNPNFAESSTAKDEEEEKKAQVLDLTKQIPLPKKETTKRKEVAFKNLSTTKEKKISKKNQIQSSDKLYTVQLGAFGTRESSETFLAKVNEAKPKSKPFIIYKNGFFVVQIGKSSDKDQLKKMISKLPSDTRSKAMVVSFIPLNK
ncbi:MAG: SPOR domain-containing protein [Leptospira sp.]|nr:SPOR domain-containing protein [Leptospira sp.]